MNSDDISTTYTILHHHSTSLDHVPIPSVPTPQAADTTAELVKPNSAPVALPKNAPGR